MPKTIGGGKYRLGSVIAAGSFGKVYQDPPFAIKEMRVPYRPSQSRQVAAIITNQIRILTQLNHDHTVKLFQVVQEGQYIFMIMELCDGDLRRYTQTGPLGQHRACQFLDQMLKGYGQIARLGIVHRDLKPANILLRDDVVKIADFGMSKLQEEGQLLRSHVGTPYYMAPQVLQRIEYTSKCDVWSLGIIFYQLIFGSLPWNGKSQESLLTAIMTQPLRYPKPVSEGVKDLLQGMLSISESRRLSFQEVQKLLQFEQKQVYRNEQRSYHWSVVKQLMYLQAQWHSKMLFKAGYQQLSKQRRKEVKQHLKGLFRQQQHEILNFLQ